LRGQGDQARKEGKRNKRQKEKRCFSGKARDCTGLFSQNRYGREDSKALDINQKLRTYAQGIFRGSSRTQGIYKNPSRYPEDNDLSTWERREGKITDRWNSRGKKLSLGEKKGAWYVFTD